MDEGGIYQRFSTLRDCSEVNCKFGSYGFKSIAEEFYELSLRSSLGTDSDKFKLSI